MLVHNITNLGLGAGLLIYSGIGGHCLGLTLDAVIHSVVQWW